MGSGKLLLMFDGFGASLVLLFTGAVGRGQRCSPVPLGAACVEIQSETTTLWIQNLNISGSVLERRFLQEGRERHTLKVLFLE